MIAKEYKLSWVESAHQMIFFKALLTNDGKEQSVMILFNQALHDIEDSFYDIKCFDRTLIFISLTNTHAHTNTYTNTHTHEQTHKHRHTHSLTFL